MHAGWVPPPRLRGRSCVYVLQHVAPNGTPRSLYVGESDSIGRRLSEHRRAPRGRGGGGPARLECVLVEVESKSAARLLEEMTIRRLKELGVAHVRNVANA